MNFLRWEWIVFLAPLGLGILLALSAVAGLGDHGTDVDSEFDSEGDLDHDGDGHVSPLEWLGVGQAPLSVIALSFLLLFAIVGLIGNFAWGIGRVGISLGLATVGAVCGTRYAVRAIARLAPSTETYGVDRHELIGSEGIALYPITQTSGTARLYDRLRTLRQLDCRVPEGDDAIPEGGKLVVTDYDSERQVFTVRRPDRVFEK